MIENDANRTLILDKNYNVILVTLRYIIWMYLGFFFSLLMADHTNNCTHSNVLPKSQHGSEHDLGHETCVKAAENPRHAGIDDAGACPRKLPFIRLGRDQENSVNTKLAVLSVFTAYVLQHKNVKTNKFQFMWCFASASAAIEKL